MRDRVCSMGLVGDAWSREGHRSLGIKGRNRHRGTGEPWAEAGAPAPSEAGSCPGLAADTDALRDKVAKERHKKA